MKYKYINFFLVEQKPKTNVYECRNNKSGVVLGILKWYGPWRQYCYFPACQAVYSKGCLEDINSFIDSLKLTKSKNNEKIG